MELTPPPVDQMRSLLAGHIVAQCLYSLASLGIPDLIASGHVTIGELAAKTGTHEPSLHRMLRTLASLGVLTEPLEGRFGLTPLGAFLGVRRDCQLKDHPSRTSSTPPFAPPFVFLQCLSERVGSV